MTRFVLLEKFPKPDFVSKAGLVLYLDSEGFLQSKNDFPALIKPNGTMEWYKREQLHRDGDKPAIIRKNGTREWYKNGQLHRDNNKPAKISNGSVAWYIEGKPARIDCDIPYYITKNKFYFAESYGRSYRSTSFAKTELLIKQIEKEEKGYFKGQRFVSIRNFV